MDDNRFEGPKSEEGPSSSGMGGGADQHHAPPRPFSVPESRGPQANNENSSGAGKKAALGALGVLGIGVLKFKGVMLAAMGSLKFGAFFAKFWTMFVMLGVYTMMFGWVYAFVIVMLLLIHEMGHYIWMKHNGLDPKLPVFVPFFGAAVQMTKLPDNQNLNAWVALAGPIAGGYTSIALYHFGNMYDLKYMMAAGWTGCFLNLFQLIPCKPFDGGFVAGAISKWFMLPGCLAIFCLAALWQVPLMFIIAIMAGFSVFMQFTGRDKSDQTMRPATLAEKTWITLAYFATAFSLGYVYFIADAGLSRVLR